MPRTKMGQKPFIFVCVLRLIRIMRGDEYTVTKVIVSITVRSVIDIVIGMAPNHWHLVKKRKKHRTFYNKISILNLKILIAPNCCLNESP